MDGLIALRRRVFAVLFVVAACGPTPATPTLTPVVAPSSSAVATETVAASAVPSVESSTAPTPTVSPNTTGPGVVGTGLGSLSGNWIFFTRLVPLDVNGRLELWGMPVGGTPRLAFSYTASIAGVGPMDCCPYLRRQFSPDGRKIVVTVGGSLVVVDLVTGSSRVVAAGQFPSWSKDGAMIAYLATASTSDPQVVPPERAIWVVPAAGGARRELTNVGYSSTAPEWSPDGTLLLAQLKDGVGLIEVASGRELSGGRIPFALSVFGAHWRSAGPFPLIVAITRENDAQLVQIEARDRRLGFPAQWARPPDPDTCNCSFQPRDPRWNPTGDDEVVFALGNRNIGEGDAVILDLRSGASKKVVSGVREVTWSADGKQLIYITQGPAGGGGVRLFDRATGADRELVPIPPGSTPGTAHMSIASVSY